MSSNLLSPSRERSKIHASVQNPSTVLQMCQKGITSSTTSEKRLLKSNILQFESPIFISPLRFVPVGFDHTAQVRAAAHAAAVQKLPGVSLNSQYRLLGSSILFFFLFNFLFLFTNDCSVRQTGLPPSISNTTVLKSKSFTLGIVDTAQFFKCSIYMASLLHK